MLLTILYLATRFWNLFHLPPFVDELLYVRWTETISQNYHNFWLPVVEDGQPPLFFWLAAIIKSLTHLDTLQILKILSIFFGLISLHLLVKLATKLYSRPVGILAGLVYVLFPMFLWYDRLAMRESAITLAGLIMIYGLVDRLIHQAKNGSYLILLGFVIGIMTKGTALIFLPVILTSFLLFASQIKLNKHDLLAGVLLTILLALLYFGGHSVITKGETFLLSLSAISGRIYPNLYSTIRWIIEYSTLPVSLLGLFGLVRLAYMKHKSFLLLSSVLFVTLVIEIVTASIYFPRYFLWTLIVWVIFIAYGASILLSHRFGRLVLLLIFVPTIIFNYKIVVDPLIAPLPAIESWQYITGWPSGYGIEALANKVVKLDIDTMVVEPNEACKTGLPYYGANNFATVLIDDVSVINQAILDGKNVYLCLNIADNYDFDGISELVQKVDRPTSHSSIRLYKLEKNNL